MYARLIMADFSSAFDTVQPNLLIKKLLEFKVNTSLTKCRTQKVKINCLLSGPKTSNIGVPQGAVSSAVLFTHYTNICQSSPP